MSTQKLIALRQFQYLNRQYSKNEVFSIVDFHANYLRSRGLVKFVEVEQDSEEDTLIPEEKTIPLSGFIGETKDFKRSRRRK